MPLNYDSASTAHVLEEFVQTSSLNSSQAPKVFQNKIAIFIEAFVYVGVDQVL